MANKSPLSPTDLPGYVGLITDATIGITELAETMHRRIVQPPFLPSTSLQHLISGIAALSFVSIKALTRWVGSGLSQVLVSLPPLWPETASSLEREALLAVLNGIVGDYLENNHNPLALPMTVRREGKSIPMERHSLQAAYPSARNKILLMVHGLCMNDLQWTWQGHDHGKALGEALDLTPVYLHYNTGRHISENGQTLSAMLEELVENWPVPVEEINIVAHSMGGLVSRSAFHYGEQAQQQWPRLLSKIVFLSTPHQGAPLERAGNYVDILLEATPYARPFARLGKIRSAGITDLRYGNLLTEDWADQDRFALGADPRTPVPLPKGIDCFAIAATMATENPQQTALPIGDGLVAVSSSLGQHTDPARALAFAVDKTWIAYESGHLEMLGNRAVYEQLKTWLKED